MDQIRHALAEAHALNLEGRQAAAYFRHIDAIHHTLSLLAGESFFSIKVELERSTVEKLFNLCEGALRQAGCELDAVLDLTKAEAEREFQSGALNAEASLPTNPPPITLPGIDVTKADPYKKVVVNGKKDQTVVTSPSLKLKEVESEFGPEPELGVRDVSNLPLIPVSSISIAYCQKMFEMQLLVQKLELLANAEPKQRGNALYLSALHQLIGKLKVQAGAKLDLSTGIRLASEMRLRDIPPADLARQITRIQIGLFKRIKPCELKMPAGDQRPIHAPNLTDFLASSQYLTHWCQYEVLRYKKDSDRAAVLTHLIRVATALSDMANYDGTKALVSGLTSIPLQRLKLTRSLLSKRMRFQLDSLDLLTSERRNYAQLRDVIARKATPCIPYIGIYLRAGRREEDISRWREFQASAYDELFPEQPIVQHYILTQPFRWEEELYALSMLREPASNKISDNSNIPNNLTAEELDRLSFPDADAYDIIRRRIQRPEHYSPSPIHPDDTNHSPSIR